MKLPFFNKINLHISIHTVIDVVILLLVCLIIFNLVRNSLSAKPNKSEKSKRPISAKMVHIPGGTFTMGSPVNEKGRLGNEIQHQVTVSSFYIGNYEVTQAEYKAVIGETSRSVYSESDLPIGEVSWFTAVEYCNLLSRKEGLVLAYKIIGTGDNRIVTWNRNANEYRLPTEAEWEYACRAGEITEYSTVPTMGRSAGGWCLVDAKPDIVGQKSGNAWGLHDMHGNVGEWYWDWYGEYDMTDQTNPTGAVYGTNRVVRGGFWYSSIQSLRSAYRTAYFPYSRGGAIGFRVARNEF